MAAMQQQQEAEKAMTPTPSSPASCSIIRAYLSALQRWDGDAMSHCFASESAAASSDATHAHADCSYASFLLRLIERPMSRSQQSNPRAKEEADLEQDRMSVQPTEDNSRMHIHCFDWMMNDIHCAVFSILSAPASLSVCVLSSPSDLPSVFRLLRRAIPDFRIELSPYSPLTDRTGLVHVVDYRLSGGWSGRLPSMTVGMYDRPIELRVLELIRLDEATGQIRTVVARIDRFQFLVQIGMAKAKL